ncbi:gluzincin family metallopeptidase [Urechidicola croceus]|uniref:Aminopeptidase n=1 Tax=Urechidicola croceus TaxID=1850246 RepID=A0A1D8P6L7_9FLAO|nr:aminopeptidase [Urechidicola croceus]AOW20209.1 aminopeptidase [Urechidicola croceus]
MKRFYFLTTSIVLFFTHVSFGQTNEIKISAILDVENQELKVQQQIKYYNKSNSNLDTIYLHNWANSFKDKNTPLSKRLIEDYDKSLYFSKEKFRGSTIINNLSINYNSVNWNNKKNAPDIIEIPLNNQLQPNDSLIINSTYTVKIPSDKFTKYGRNRQGYNLRYWYLVPAFYDNDWQLMSNLNMDDLLMDFSNYSISLTIPQNFVLSTELNSTYSIEKGNKTYKLEGENRTDIELSINSLNDFEIFNTDDISVETNLNTKNLDSRIKTDILNREIAFIEKHLGKYPHDKILLNKISYSKNKVYGLSQLPSFLRPFSDVFEWDIKMFKTLSSKYIEKAISVNHRKDSWLIDGLQTYLMIEYVHEFYPEVKAMGSVSKFWGVRRFNLADLNFNDKYPFVYQFASRKNVDQPLTMRSDSLSNFNRKIVNKYKAGLGIRYLNEFLGDSIIPNNIKEFYNKNILNFTNSNEFKNLVIEDTDENLSWFFGDYVTSKKKIDYTIKKVKVLTDSIEVTIKNLRNMTVPVALYGVKDKEIHFKKWYTNIDSTKTITIPKNGFNRLSLNYEYLYPELNVRNNWKSTTNNLLNRPLQFRFFKDIEDPYYNQIYYSPTVKYNYYDGLQLGMSLTNKTIQKKNFVYKITPYYSTKTNNITGSFSFLYEYLPENSKVYKYQFGTSGSYFHYAPDLIYRTFSPFAIVNFKRKSLRDVGGSRLIADYVTINRDLDPNATTPNPESNKYSVFNLGYSYSKPEIIEDLRYSTNLEVASKFSKLTFDFRYRKLTERNRQFDFRIFAGAFLKNKTETDFFSFGLTRQSDYLFRLNYFGRSENSGFFSKQYITNEGGFKSYLPQNYANQWLASMNTSIGLWRWVEVYNDIGFLKNKNEPVYFAYENGVRLNFVHEILEVYFPLYSNNGWEVNQSNYSSRIRFVLTINPKKIINFVKRGFY